MIIVSHELLLNAQDEELQEIKSKWLNSAYADEFIGYDIYSGMTHDEYKRLILQKWKELNNE